MAMVNSVVQRRFSLFDGLEKEQIDRVLNLMKQEEFEAEKEIIVQGGHNEKVHFILDGRVLVIKDGVILMELVEGAIFGEMEILEVSPVEATIKTVTATEVMTLSLDALGELYDNDLKIYSFIIMNLARDLCRRFKLINTRVVKESPPSEWS